MWMTSFPLFRLRELHLGVGVRPEEESKGGDGREEGRGIFEFDSDVASSPSSAQLRTRRMVLYRVEMDEESHQMPTSLHFKFLAILEYFVARYVSNFYMTFSCSLHPSVQVHEEGLWALSLKLQ